MTDTQTGKGSPPRVHAVFSECENGALGREDIPDSVSDKAHSVKCWARDNVAPPFIVAKIIARGRAVEVTETVID